MWISAIHGHSSAKKCFIKNDRGNRNNDDL